MDAKEIRKEFIEKRSSLLAEEQAKAGDNIYSRVLKQPEFFNADKILLYAEAKGEAPVEKLLLKALLLGKRVYAPVCIDKEHMEFYEIYSKDELYPASFGLREPLTIEYLKLNKSDISKNTLALVPGVAFDKKLNRMGYGRGYYDRFFEEFEIPYRIGIAYEFQVLEEIKAKATDVAMTKIITDRNIYE